MTDLRQAAKAVVDRWDTLLWSWSEKTPTAILMAALRKALEQPEQEPVAWDKPGTNFNDWWNGDYDDSANPFEKDSAAYWAWAGWQAAQRPWVGLTEAEHEDIVEWLGHDVSSQVFYAIEAKLKERNT
jgi:hypothetical protein